MTPVFDFAQSEIDEDDILWMKGVDIKTDEIVAIQSMRRFDLRGVTLAEHLADRVAEYVPPTVADKVDLSATLTNTARISCEITGWVVYQGGLWVSPKVRGGGAATVFARAMMYVAAHVWLPDYMFCFIAPERQYRGLDSRIGYSHIKEVGIRWGLKDGSEIVKDIIWQTQADLEDILTRRPDELFGIVEGMRPAIKGQGLSRV